MQPHGGHGQPEPLPSHCVSPMSQGGQGGGVASQSVPDPHQVMSGGALVSDCFFVALLLSAFMSSFLCVSAGPPQLSVLSGQPAEHEELVLQ